MLCNCYSVGAILYNFEMYFKRFMLQYLEYDGIKDVSASQAHVIEYSANLP